MTITIEPTDQVVEMSELPQRELARVWRGITERGIACLVFIPCVAVANELDSAEFERELAEVPLSDGLFLVPLDAVLR